MENRKLRDRLDRVIARRGEIDNTLIEPIKIINPILHKYLNELKFFTYGIERSIDKLVENPNILEPIFQYFDYNEFNYYADSLHSEIKNKIVSNEIDAEKYAIECFNHCYECDKNLDFFIRNFYERVTKRAERGDITHDDFSLIADNIDSNIKNGVWLINSTLTDYLFLLIVDNFADDNNKKIREKRYVEKYQLLNEYFVQKKKYFEQMRKDRKDEGLTTFHKLLIRYYKEKSYKQQIFSELSKDWGVTVDAVERAAKRLEKFKEILKGTPETKRIIDSYIQDLKCLKQGFIDRAMTQQVAKVDLDIKKLSEIQFYKS